jgi:NADP-dependent 3-hydroxy acid dehydrogenase YdfG
VKQSNESSKGFALLTGATSGIGRALLVKLAAAGYIVGAVGRNRALLEATVADLGVQATCKIYQADLADDHSLRALAAHLAADHGQLDVLIHSAGVFKRGGVESGSLEDLDSALSVNVRAPFLLTRALLPALKSSRGQVVFVNSSVAAGSVAGPGTIYGISKYALKALADGLRSDVNADGIRVLSVFPGRTATPMQALVHRLEGKEYHAELLLQPEDVADTVLGALTLPRTAEVTDLHVRPMLKT